MSMSIHVSDTIEAKAYMTVNWKNGACAQDIPLRTVDEAIAAAKSYLRNGEVSSVMLILLP